MSKCLGREISVWLLRESSSIFWTLFLNRPMLRSEIISYFHFTDFWPSLFDELLYWVQVVDLKLVWPSSPMSSTRWSHHLLFRNNSFLVQWRWVVKLISDGSCCCLWLLSLFMQWGCLLVSCYCTRQHNPTYMSCSRHCGHGSYKMHLIACCFKQPILVKSWARVVSQHPLSKAAIHVHSTWHSRTSLLCCLKRCAL